MQSPTSLSDISLKTMIIIVCTLAAAWLFLAWLVAHGSTLAIDQQLSHYVYSWRTPWLTSVFTHITTIGDAGIFILSAVVVSMLVIKHYLRYALIFSGIVIGGEVLNFLLKQVVQRPRPDMAQLIVERGFSFPSGHAMNSLILYSLITLLTYRLVGPRAGQVVGVVGIVLVGLIGLSRVYLGVHYPTDIIAGYIAGLCWICSCYLVLRYKNVISDNQGIIDKKGSVAKHSTRTF